jgi:hypothetical protein
LTGGKKGIAVIGLYLAFWSVNTTCPLFAVDAYSTSAMEFRIPLTGIPILLELMEAKSKTGQQIFATLP